MKRGQIMSISRQLPTDSPFKSYQDLQKHWQSLYGYRLPEQTVEEQIYCSVYFKLVGERLFTYPLSCIRLQPVYCCPRVDLQVVLHSFISDLRDRLQSVCDLPVHMTSKPCYYTSSLTSTGSAQVLDGKPVNLTTRSSIRPVLTQLPAPAAPPRKPLFGLQLPGRPPVSLQPGGVSWGERKEVEVRVMEERQGGVYGCSGARTQTPSSGGESARSSSASATAASLQPSCSSAQPSPLSSLLTATHRPGTLPLKLVPIFRNRSLMRHVNVTQLLAQKQQDQRERGAADGWRVTLANYKNKRVAPAASSSFPPSDPCLASSSSSSSSTLPSSLFVWSQRPHVPIAPPSLSLPSPTHCSKSGGVHSRQLSHGRRPKANHISAPVPHNRPNPKMNLGAHQRGDAMSECERRTPSSILSPSAPAGPFDPPSNKGGETFESKPKKARLTIQEVDVESMAKNNQLSKVNSATLLAWLRGRGVVARVKDKKEELMLRVMSCLAEA
ncbi:hypothetical protein N1851_029607 [Merluccius polli]|uniref:DUF4708 domain-containing protein n=1 Tax=Merluccius polli TaxID=89951 RepID=A0AA47NSK0_MERPO|nr:hypothetical protein N1851_029607 [Merluccius polli]